MKFLYFLCVFFFIYTSTKAKDGRIPARSVYIVYSYVNPDEGTLHLMSSIMLGQEKKDFKILQNGTGLWINITIIPSAHPENYTTIRSLDAKNYPADFFMNLYRQYNKSGDALATYKGLLKAAQMASQDDGIMVISDTELRDDHLLPEILNLTLKKNLGVSNPNYKNFNDNNALIKNHDQISFNPFTSPSEALQFIKKSSLELRYILMLGGQQQRNLILNSKVTLLEECLISKQSNSSAKSTRKSREPIKSYNTSTAENLFSDFSTAHELFSAKNVRGFVYDMAHATENDTIDIAIKMEGYFTNRTNSASNNTLGFPVVSSLYPDTPWVLNTELYYTRDSFRNGIPHYNATNDHKTSLKALQKALEFTNSANGAIVYFTDNEPKNGYELLPEIVQKLYQDDTEIIFHTYGNLSNATLPLLYKTLASASKYSQVLDYIRSSDYI